MRRFTHLFSLGAPPVDPCQLERPQGRGLELDSRSLKRLELGALLHDIGKIGIPPSFMLLSPCSAKPFSRPQS